MIFVGVGTFVHGFDALIDGADRAAAELSLAGFAQIGHSTIVPRHLAHARFLAPTELRARLAASRVAICHAGMGLIGDALRAGCQLVLVPRRGSTTRRHPANDQLGFAQRLASQLPVTLCLDTAALAPAIVTALQRPAVPLSLPHSTVPDIVRRFLAASGKA